MRFSLFDRQRVVENKNGQGENLPPADTDNLFAGC